MHPTLGSPIRSIDEIYERLGNLHFAAELKYDGQRAQIHGQRKQNGQVVVRIFSRHLEDMTSKVRVDTDLDSIGINVLLSTQMFQPWSIASSKGHRKRHLSS